MAYRRTTQVQARLEATRDRIVDAAVRRLATAGWAGISVAAVARDAQVATGSVYRHLDDKDALLAAAFRRAAGRELQVVTDAASAEDAPAARLESALRVFADRALQGRRLAYALLAEPAGAAVEAERLTYRAGYRALFQEILLDGIADGTVHDHDAEVVAAVLVGAMGEAVVGPVAPVDASPRDGARLDALVATCLRAVPFTTDVTTNATTYATTNVAADATTNATTGVTADVPPPEPGATP